MLKAPTAGCEPAGVQAGHQGGVHQGDQPGAQGGVPQGAKGGLRAGSQTIKHLHT